MQYDAIVIGSGIGGLTAAGRLARRGLRVLVLERHSVVGGYCSTFRRGRFIFDAAVHAIGGCEHDDLIGQWLKELEIDGKISFFNLDPFFRVVVQDEYVDLPANLELLGRTLIEIAGLQDAEKIKRMIECIRMTGRILMDDSHNPLERARVLQDKGALSWAAFLQQWQFHCSKVMPLMQALCIYAGLEPQRLSTAFMATVLCSYDRGAYYPAGGTQNFADTLAAAIRKWGGEVRCRVTVDRIIIQSGQVRGVKLGTGEELSSNIVISNADAVQTFTALIDQENIPGPFRRRREKLEVAVSGVALYLGVQEGDWNPPTHETFYLPDWAPITAETFYYRPGAGVPILSICAPTISDSSLAPEGSHVICALACCRADEIEAIRTERGKAFITQDMLQHVERLIPNISASIRYQETATPRTMERFTKNSMGALYGWAKSVDQPAGGIGPRTPFEGLYLAGHWTPGVHGIYGAFRSGCSSADTVLKDLNLSQG